MGDCGDHRDPRPNQSLENSIPADGNKTWGVDDWAWDPQACQANPKGDMQAEQECSAPPQLAQALPLQTPISIPSVSEDGTAGTVSAVAGDSGGSGAAVPGGTSSGSKLQTNCRPGYCQADGCGKNLSKMTFYHVRNKICDIHIKADVFLRDGISLRFCQRCGHPHELAEFDGTKHSCRAQLEKHNARRRKRQAEAAQQKLAKPATVGVAAAQPAAKTKRGGRRQTGVAAPADEEEERKAEAQAIRRSNRKRRAVPVEDESEEEAKAVQGSVEGSPLPHTSSDVPKSEEAKQSKGYSSPSLPQLGVPAGDCAGPAGGAPPQGLDFGNEDLLPDDLSSWLIANLSDIEDLGWPALDGPSRSPSPPPPPQNMDVSIAPPNLPDGTTSFDFAASLMQLEMADARGETSASTAALSAALPSGPNLTKEAMLSVVSVKLFGCTPAELPDNLRSQLVSWFDGQVASLEGYMRPGCVHLTVQATVSAPAVVEQSDAAEGEKVKRAAAEAQPSEEGAVRGTKRREPEGEGAGRALQASLATGGVVRLVDKMLASGEPLWRTKTLLVQTGGEVALVHGGKLQQTWDVASSMQERVVPAILEMKPMVLLASSSSPNGGGCIGKAQQPPAQVIVQGVNLLQDDCEIVCRLQGEYVTIENAKCSECSCAAVVKSCCRSSTEAPSPSADGWESKCCGCCVAKLASLSHEEPPEQPAAAPMPSCCGGAAAKKDTSATTKSAGVESVTPQLVSLKLSGALRPGVLHIDVLKKAYIAPRGGRVLVVDSPAVHAELLSLAERAPAAGAAWVEALGIIFEWVGDRNKVRYSVVERTASRLLHEALGYGLVEIAKYLHGLVQSGLMNAAASLALPKNKSVGALDALAILSQADQACRTATMIRIDRLGCVGGLSLLHRAVQSQDPAVVDLVVAWGREAERPWRCDLSGPQGLTPLHLATLLKNPIAAARNVLTLVASCEPGLAAWKGAVTTDGLTPADFATKLKRTGLLDAFGSKKADSGAGRVPALPEVAHEEEEVAPSTPRRCKCSGPCPCALSAEPCAGCNASSDDEACCGDGTCSCCAKATDPAEDTAPQCCGRNTAAGAQQPPPPAPSLPPVRTCCR